MSISGTVKDFNKTNSPAAPIILLFKLNSSNINGVLSGKKELKIFSSDTPCNEPGVKIKAFFISVFFTKIFFSYSFISSALN